MPYLPYTADSYFKSAAPTSVDATKTKSFHAFMASHPDQRSTAFPLLKGVAPNKWGTVYAEGKATDPIWKIRNLASASPKNAILKTQGFRAPEWFGSLFTGTSDSPACVMDTASGFTVFLTKAKLVAGTKTIDVGSAGVTYHSSNGLDYRNKLTNDQRNMTSRGRISDAMVIRKDLVDQGIANNTSLGHVLHFFIVESKTSEGHCHPMVGSESDKNGWGAEGERLAIRPDIDLTTRGLTPGGLVVARTLQKHGMYVGDNAGSASSLKCEQESSSHPVWKGVLTPNSLSGIKWTDFVVLAR